MSIGSKIAMGRKELGLTQDALAQKLGVTNQAVSKWESEQSCPDIQLLPRIADIFGMTMDELFEREPDPEKVKMQYASIFGAAEESEEQKGGEPRQEAPKLPWADDGVLRVVLYLGHTLIGGGHHENITFEYEGPALNVESAVCVTCGEVAGNVTCSGDVNCENVLGHVAAEGDINCDDVAGNVKAEGNVACDTVKGSVSAGGDVTCDEVSGSVQAGGDVTCDDIGGNANAGGDITCDGIGGSAMAGGDVSCEGSERSFHFSAGSSAEGDESCEENACEGDCMNCDKNSFTFSFGGKNGKMDKDGKKKKGFTLRF